MLNSSLELSTLSIFPEVPKSVGITPKHFKRCEKCLKFSCVCREMQKSSKIKLRTRLSPNNFKRYLPDVEKYRNPAGLGCVIMPSISTTNKNYVPYIYSKKKIGYEINSESMKRNSYSMVKFKNQAKKVLFSTSFKKKFDREKFMKDKIVRIGNRYLKDPEMRYQRKKLIELLYNLIQKGEKGDYACSIKRKIEDIAVFLVRHNSDLKFENFLLNESEKEEQSVGRFDEFLKAFSSSIVK